MKDLQPALMILTPGFPKDEEDSTCLPPVQNFIKALNEQSPSLKIIILSFDYPFISTTYYWNNNTVLSFNGWGKRHFKKLYKWILIRRAMYTLKRNNNIIGLLSFWCGECAFLGNRFAKNNDLTNFCWIQGQDAKKENKYVSRSKTGATELVALSDFIAFEFEKNHKIRPKHIIPIGINPADFTGENVTRDIDIIGVGSLIPLKQYEVFIEVISKIKTDLPAIKAVLCGKGPEENKLNGLIIKYGLEKNITLTGELPHAEILKQMKRSKVFLHSSNYEGFGIVCIEALYAGCRVISFVQPMSEEIENWQIVKTKEEMAKKAMIILHDQKTIYTTVLPFTIKETAKKIMQLFNYKEATNC